jgi:multisubunit Na+/H+ antiporter MnhB subunit
MVSNNQLQRRKTILMLLIFIMTVLIVIATALLTRLFLSTILWFLSGNFDMSWNDVLHGIKLGFIGGSICGAGIILFRLFKVKGF